jgi:hypothetical protein
MLAAHLKGKMHISTVTPKAARNASEVLPISFIICYG